MLRAIFCFPRNYHSMAKFGGYHSKMSYDSFTALNEQIPVKQYL